MRPSGSGPGQWRESGRAARRATRPAPPVRVCPLPPACRLRSFPAGRQESTATASVRAKGSGVGRDLSCKSGQTRSGRGWGASVQLGVAAGEMPMAFRL
jgi:hypothetical protein